MDSTAILAVACGLVLVFHGLDIAARALRVPSVLLLLAAGVAASSLAKAVDHPIQLPEGVLSGVGLAGLALIVLEGSLGLAWRPGHGAATSRAIAAAALGILAFVVPATLAVHQAFDVPWRTALLNAMPLSVISSAIAIPSAARLDESSREFVTLESSLSDIFGVLAFNALLLPSALGVATLVGMGWRAALVVLSALALTALILRLLRMAPRGVRFIPLLAALMLFFSVGKLLHLPSLLVVFLFGLAVANVRSLPAGPMRRWLEHDAFHDDVHQLEVLVGELAFLVRTFFFFLFGWSLDLRLLATLEPWLLGLGFLLLVYAGRWAVLAALRTENRRRLLFLAPRGLITVLLFSMVPAVSRLVPVAEGAALVVILGTTLGQVLGGRAISEAAGIAPLEELLPIGRSSHDR